MTNHEENLAAVLRERGLAAGLVVASDGSTLAQVGDPSSAGCQTLMSALVGPYGDARTTFDSLEGRILPTILGQGDSFAFVDKPSSDFMVIVFGRGGSVRAQYDLSKRVSTTIHERWAALP